MKLQLVRHLWGVDLAHGLSPYVERWRAFGYTAIEAGLGHGPNGDAAVKEAKKAGFGWIPQVFSASPGPVGSVREHIDSLRQQVERALPYEPLFVNAHSGVDAWSEAQAEEFYGLALELERKAGVAIAHETHRARYFATPWATDGILKKFPALKLTCDFSHWVCVCERLLPDLGEVITRAAKQCHHLHARVGHEHGPQVSDPSAPEFAGHVAAHEGWWDQIWTSQRGRGYAVSTLTPEFGPPNYMPTLPHTRQPVADLATVCDWMAARQRTRFEAAAAKR